MVVYIYSNNSLGKKNSNPKMQQVFLQQPCGITEVLGEIKLYKIGKLGNFNQILLKNKKSLQNLLTLLWNITENIKQW